MAHYLHKHQYPPFPRKSHDEPDSTAQLLYNSLSHKMRQMISQPEEFFDWETDPRYGTLLKIRRWSSRRFSRVARAKAALAVVWLLVLWWGERLVFKNSISACRWENWEHWPSEATPHHLLLLADPQLVDPHTYPGRPWPLSTLTVRHTDMYLQKAFFSMHQILDPDTVIFLGDLFDGGREWATGLDNNPDIQWRSYGGEIWFKEYDRFGRIFLNTWLSKPSQQSRGREERRFIASLPGNHDLGIGNGIRLPVRNRFNSYFGEGNRIDYIGNHTFVSVDTVSLSARGQPQSDQTIHESQDAPNKEIWGKSEAFLAQVKRRKAIVIDRELRSRSGKPDTLPQLHSVLEIGDPHSLIDIGDPALQAGKVIHEPDFSQIPQLPTILLTHVPLWRAPGTPCGPLRERWPPSRGNDQSREDLEKDERNAISVAAGHQYQNVLLQDISQELIDKVGNVEYVFSGDDHDYCEIVHHGYTSRGGGVREITVKSMSWAMGIRKPGFLMVSLWNPIDEDGNALGTPGRSGDSGDSTKTLKSHLCLLPDQLSIFIRYALLLGFTLTVLVVRAVAYAQKTHASTPSTANGYPMSSSASGVASPNIPRRDRAGSKAGSSSLKIPGEPQFSNLAARNSAARTRSVSPANGYAISIGDYGQGVVARGKFDDSPDWNEVIINPPTPHRGSNGLAVVWHEVKQSVMQVAALPLIWYVWLAYTN